MTVSYTHLDVYKRQLESFAKHSSIDLKVKTIGDLHIDMHHSVEDTGIVMAVSYTHLDVYKRQDSVISSSNRLGGNPDS